MTFGEGVLATYDLFSGISGLNQQEISTWYIRAYKELMRQYEFESALVTDTITLSDDDTVDMFTETMVDGVTRWLGRPKTIYGNDSGDGDRGSRKSWKWIPENMLQDRAHGRQPNDWSDFDGRRLYSVYGNNWDLHLVTAYTGDIEVTHYADPPELTSNSSRILIEPAYEELPKMKAALNYSRNIQRGGPGKEIGSVRSQMVDLRNEMDAMIQNLVTATKNNRSTEAESYPDPIVGGIGSLRAERGPWGARVRVPYGARGWGPYGF